MSTPRAEVGQPIARFLRLPNPSPQPAAPDEALSFRVEPIPGTGTGAWWLGAIWPAEDGNPSVAIAGRSAIQVSGTSGEARCQALSGGSSVAVADLNYDFRLDLAVAGSNGLCLLRRGEDGRFTDVTALSKLPPALLQSAAHAVWPADIDTDGDLDLVLALRDAAPVVLRNNGDGTFAPREVFGGITRARAFVWADLDGEGVPDAAFADDTGAVQLFLNLRGGVFRAENLPAPSARAVAIAASEHSGDALMDLLLLDRAGAITRVARNPRDDGWESRQIATVEGFPAAEPGAARMLTADLDNNGAADLIVSAGASGRVLLASTDRFVTLPRPACRWTCMVPSISTATASSS